jgi:hypothetical protein
LPTRVGRGREEGDRRRGGSGGGGRAPPESPGTGATWVQFHPAYMRMEGSISFGAAKTVPQYNMSSIILIYDHKMYLPKVHIEKKSMSTTLSIYETIEISIEYIIVS